MKRIESASNPLVKTIRRLAHPRKRESRFLLEGRKLLETALESGTPVETLLVSTELLEPLEPLLERAAARGTRVASARASLLRSISRQPSPEGVLAIAARSSRSLETLPEQGRLVVSIGIQDPGNLGAVARVAEATGCSGLVVVKGWADPFGPKALRGSMGSLLRVPVFEAESQDSALSELETRGFRLIASVPRNGDDYRGVEWSPPLALVLGGESSGLTNELVGRCAVATSVPMAGAVESLNVATVAALLLYEATRRSP